MTTPRACVVRGLTPGRIFLLSKISDLPGHEADHSPLVPRLRMNAACHCYNVFKSSRAVTGLILIYTCMQVSYGLAS